MNLKDLTRYMDELTINITEHMFDIKVTMDKIVDELDCMRGWIDEAKAELGKEVDE